MTPLLGRADLHVHTLASDGVSSVAEVLERAAELGLDVLAITDHDWQFEYLSADARLLGAEGRVAGVRWRLLGGGVA